MLSGASASRSRLATTPSGVTPVSNSTRRVAWPPDGRGAGPRSARRTRARRAARPRVDPPTASSLGSTGIGPAEPFSPQRRTSPTSGSSMSQELSITVVMCTPSTGCSPTSIIARPPRRTAAGTGGPPRWPGRRGRAGTGSPAPTGPDADHRPVGPRSRRRSRSTSSALPMAHLHVRSGRGEAHTAPGRIRTGTEYSGSPFGAKLQFCGPEIDVLAPNGSSGGRQRPNSGRG